MSDKPRERLNPIDRALRQAVPVCGFCSGTVQLTIEKVCGFEKFNTRPYHNYETWADGWRVTDGTVTVEREDLDDAVNAWAAARAARDAETAGQEQT